MTGVVIGRFMPPHQGHQYLVNFAAEMVDSLYVLVCTLSWEPIPGELRYHWMRDLFPDTTVVHITEEIPEAQRDEPQAAAIWADAVRRYVPEPIDRVFASESYGTDLSSALGATFIPVDPSRNNIPVSATAIRNDPMAYWRFIPPVVRPYFLRHIAVTGDIAVLEELARILDTVMVHSYAAFAQSLDDAAERYAPDGQRATILALSRLANRVLLHANPAGESVPGPSGPRPFDLTLRVTDAAAAAAHIEQALA